MTRDDLKSSLLCLFNLWKALVITSDSMKHKPTTLEVIAKVVFMPKLNGHIS